MTKPISIGRKLLCLENPRTRATSRCAKTLGRTIATAQRGLNQEQKKLWQTFVYQPAVRQVERFCGSIDYVVLPGAEDVDANGPFKNCVMSVLTGRWKFEGLRKQKYQWTRYLNDGARVVKKLTTRAPVRRTRVRNRAAE